jgi:chemotaxis-related protein WspB
VLALLFELGNDRYALDTANVIEVLPLVHLRQLSAAPSAVAGVFDFRGTPVPAIDLAQLTLGRPAEPRLSTRIIVVSTSAEGGGARTIGLIAERATTAARRDASEFVWIRVDDDQSRYLGPVATDERGLLQLVDLGQLLRMSCTSPISSAS